MVRSGKTPLEFVMVQFVLFDEHLIGSAGGVETTPWIVNRKKKRVDLDLITLELNIISID